MPTNTNESKFIKEIVDLIRSGLSKEKLTEKLQDYHDNDIAQALENLDKNERIAFYHLLDTEWLSEIITFLDEPEKYISEIEIEKLAAVINEMDSDDAVDLLEEIDEDVKEKLRPILNEDVKADINLINSYDEDEIGSLMTTNYICINRSLNIRQAMRELIQQAGENDNISTLYVTDDDGKFYGAIDLKDLIIARENDELSALISESYPYLMDHDKISDSIENIKDYAEDSLPVLNNEKEILGIITAQDVIEVVDDEMGEDYAKLAGLTAEEDLKETTRESMSKRLPWLIILLFLGMAVSTVVGAFESVVAVLPIVICFQSLILDMAGNVGTQSLAVTIRVLMDERLSAKDKFMLVVKEMKVGFSNGLLLGVLAFVCLGIYIGFQRDDDAVSLFDLGMRGNFTAGGNGHIQSGRNSGAYVFPQDKGGSGCGIRSLDHHRQRSGGGGYLLWTGVDISDPCTSYRRIKERKKNNDCTVSGLL